MRALPSCVSSAFCLIALLSSVTLSSIFFGGLVGNGGADLFLGRPENKLLQELPGQTVLVSNHFGSKFDFIRPLFEHNKKSFCDLSGTSCFIPSREVSDASFDLSGQAADDARIETAEDNSKELQALHHGDMPPLRARKGGLWYGMRTPVPGGGAFNNEKYRSMLAALQTNPAATNVLWVDGDTWILRDGTEQFRKIREWLAKYDYVIGRDKRRPFESNNDEWPHRVCVYGVNTGVFAVRRSAWTLWFLQYMATQRLAKSDQCIVNDFLIYNASFRDHTRVLYLNETSILQCRYRCKHLLCCKKDSWLVHWPAHERRELLLRVFEIHFQKTSWLAAAFLALLVCVACSFVNRTSGRCRADSPALQWPWIFTKRSLLMPKLR
eukprot:TRINITY_DN73765_c0_g1_i1.p1 TRINITY_DN73765_c0_g1~~TRINITY_DN73765_c0_g1_i1.p1  ORF type:complete len:381 (-),score=40.16 TRINITY_DN73765_c0_g1_i1:521-1663(-)